MTLPLLLLAALAPVASSTPITVTGHAWAPFISPMGEPFRARSISDDTLAIWFYQADRDRDGRLTVDEMEADAARFFATLDTDHNGAIEPEELIRYEWEVAPDIQLSAKTRRAPGQPRPEPTAREDDPLAGIDGSSPRREGKRRERDSGLEGAARYALLNIPEPVAAADSDFNRSITLAEFRQAAIERFQLLDKGRSGGLTLPALESMSLAIRNKVRRHGDDDMDTRYGSALPPQD